MNSGLAWTRPIRMGGVQFARDYTARPDLVTTPTANLSGSAAVPSSVDVYMNNFKIYTQDVDPGPYRIDNLPLVGGNGVATLALRDINGNETTQTVPFFSSPRLLASGAFDYSAEAGYARTYYGERSFSYDPNPIGSASVRGSLTDWATLEAHTEDGAGLLNGGAGLVFSAFQRGVVEAALAGSGYQDGRGLQLAVGGSTAIAGALIDVSSQRTFGPFSDLAQVTAPRTFGTNVPQLGPTGGLFASPTLLSISLAPPKALDRISIGLPNLVSAASVSLTFVNQLESNGSRARIASVALSRNFTNNASVFVTAYADFANRHDSGFFAGLSWTFDGQVTATSQAALQGGSASVTTEVSKSAGQDIGAYGWRVLDQEGLNRYTEANGSYLSPIGKASLTASQYGWGPTSTGEASADLTGSIATLGGAVKLAPAIPDSFALVEAGAPGVAVLEDNRLVGKTNSSGQLLLTGLRGFENNKISIDPTTLPLSAQTGMTETTLRPRGRSGVLADFKVAVDARDAEIILTDASGAPLPPGGRVEYSGGSPSVIGYDGRTYLGGLAPQNVVRVHSEGKTCTAAFDYHAATGAARPTIGPIPCRVDPSDVKDRVTADPKRLRR